MTIKIEADAHSSTVCGHNSKMLCDVARKRAIRECTQLVTTLGDNWAGRVWENLGWHYEAWLGPIRVRRCLEARQIVYRAYIHQPGENSGFLAEWNINNHFKTPKAAVLAAVKHAEEHLIEIMAEYSQHYGQLRKLL